MGLFRRKKRVEKTPVDDKAKDAEHEVFLDDYFREELRNRSRWYFEKIIKTNAELFKDDLDDTVARINSELKEQLMGQLKTTVAKASADMQARVSQELGTQMNEYRSAIGTMQQEALQSLAEGEQLLKQQHQQLSQRLETDIAAQETAFRTMLDGSKARLETIGHTQETVLDELNATIQTLQAQQQQLSQALQDNVARQETLLLGAFESNMARIVEHYLLGAVSEQYDLKAQLPAIIKQLETNKQSMVDDMRL